MILNSETGVIFGKAVIRGTWNFTVRASDSQNSTATAAQNFTINVRLHAGN
jgi:hypothetical protein